MQYSAIQGANSLIRLSFKKKNAISPLKLQKLLYFIHGWYLAWFDRSIFNEQPEAWVYGPVFPEVYHDYKIFGSVPITEENWEIYGSLSKGEILPDDQDFSLISEKVWNLYSPYDGLFLSKLTHQEGTPWSLARQRGALFLDENEIKQHFRQLMNE